MSPAIDLKTVLAGRDGSAKAFVELLADEGKRPDDLVFTAPAGGALNNRNWTRRSFERAMTQLLGIYPDLLRLTPHELRHTAASLAISAGSPDDPAIPANKGLGEGGPGGARTHDQRIKSPTLCQLSYRPYSLILADG